MLIREGMMKREETMLPPDITLHCGFCNVVKCFLLQIQGLSRLDDSETLEKMYKCCNELPKPCTVFLAEMALLTKPGCVIFVCLSCREKICSDPTG